MLNYLSTYLQTFLEYDFSFWALYERSLFERGWGTRPCPCAWFNENNNGGTAMNSEYILICFLIIVKKFVQFSFNTLSSRNANYQWSTTATGKFYKILCKSWHIFQEENKTESKKKRLHFFIMQSCIPVHRSQMPMCRQHRRLWRLVWMKRPTAPAVVVAL